MFVVGNTEMYIKSQRHEILYIGNFKPVLKSAVFCIL